jgi:hypothetical protein
VKWLSRLTVAEARPEGLFTTRLYNRPVLVDGRPTQQPARGRHVLQARATDVRGRTQPTSGRNLVFAAEVTAR